MATLEHMTWSKGDKRWHKGYRGRRYAVSPRQLKTASTKEASRAAANEWWERKQKQIDEALGVAKQHPARLVKDYEWAIKRHKVYAWWHRKYGEGEEDLAKATRSESAVERLQAALKTDAPTDIEGWDYDPVWDEEDYVTSQHSWMVRTLEYDKERQAETAAPKDDTIRRMWMITLCSARNKPKPPTRSGVSRRCAIASTRFASGLTPSLAWMP